MPTLSLLSLISRNSPKRLGMVSPEFRVEQKILHRYRGVMAQSFASPQRIFVSAKAFFNGVVLADTIPASPERIAPLWLKREMAHRQRPRNQQNWSNLQGGRASRWSPR